MKVLSVPQPYASLITAGIVDIMIDVWKSREVPTRILIYANRKKIPYSSFIANEDIEFWQDVKNHITFGNVPEYPDMPCGAIIGFVTVDSIEQSDYNNRMSYVWNFKDAHLFDEPIIGVNGKPRLWDYELDENNLPPSHKVEIREVKLNLRTGSVEIPLSKSKWNGLTPNGSITLELDETLDEALKEQDETRIVDEAYEGITFTYNGLKRTFFLNPWHPDEILDLAIGFGLEIYPSFDEAGIQLANDSSNDDETERWLIDFNWNDEIK